MGRYGSGKICGECDCDEEHFARGKCVRHYHQDKAKRIFHTVSPNSATPENTALTNYLSTLTLVQLSDHCHATKAAYDAVEHGW